LNGRSKNYPAAERGPLPSRIRWVRGVKGAKLPDDAVLVTRVRTKDPTYLYRFGNPFRPDDPNNPVDVSSAVDQFRHYAEDRLRLHPDWLEPLRGKRLACNCLLDRECHGDVLIEMANRAVAVTR
jgi:hypothetical protein